MLTDSLAFDLANREIMSWNISPILYNWINSLTGTNTKYYVLFIQFLSPIFCKQPHSDMPWD
jgi:hypothetical protein